MTSPRGEFAQEPLPSGELSMPLRNIVTGQVRSVSVHRTGKDLHQHGLQPSVLSSIAQSILDFGDDLLIARRLNMVTTTLEVLLDLPPPGTCRSAGIAVEEDPPHLWQTVEDPLEVG